MNKKVYIVQETDGFESWISAIFLDEQKAHAYCKIQEQLSSGMYSYYVDERELNDDSFDENKTKVVDYYSFYIDKDEPIKTFEECVKMCCWDVYVFLLNDARFTVDEVYDYEKARIEIGKVELSDEEKSEIIAWVNDIENSEQDEEPERRIYTQDLVINDTEDYLEVFSVKDFETAKQEALKIYENWKNR